jgi:hypothetical protein
MSVQPPVAPHRVAIADFDIPFWRIVMILVKWSFAAIPAMIIISIIYAIFFAAIGGVLYGLGLKDLLTQMISQAGH